MKRQRQLAICAGCIVYRFLHENIEVLLIKPFQSADAWGIPKGHVEDSESLIDCAIRETWEETGITCIPSIQLDTVETINRKEHKYVHAFLARHLDDTEPNPITKKEVADIKWFSINKLPKLHYYQISLMNQATEMLKAMQSSG